MEFFLFHVTMSGLRVNFYFQYGYVLILQLDISAPVSYHSPTQHTQVNNLLYVSALKPRTYLTLKRFKLQLLEHCFSPQK